MTVLTVLEVSGVWGAELAGACGAYFAHRDRSFR